LTATCQNFGTQPRQTGRERLAAYEEIGPLQKSWQTAAPFFAFDFLHDGISRTTEPFTDRVHDSTVVTMRHLDGFTIELRRTDGTKFTEYTNPDEKRHAEFLGAFGSRIINANDGEELTVMLKFEQNFRLHNAHGVYICIGLGEAQGPLSRADNAQVFWLPKEHIVLGREYKVREFHLWEKPESHEPTSHLPLRVPAPAPDREYRLNHVLMSLTAHSEPGKRFSRMAHR
jgi:hypothetical protein